MGTARLNPKGAPLEWQPHSWELGSSFTLQRTQLVRGSSGDSKRREPLPKRLLNLQSRDITGVKGREVFVLRQNLQG